MPRIHRGMAPPTHRSAPLGVSGNTVVLIGGFSDLVCPRYNVAWPRLSVAHAPNQQKGIPVKISDVAGLTRREDWLMQIQQDLERRLETHVATLEADWHLNDPLYQRLWFALARVQGELSRMAKTPSSQRQ